MFLVVPALGADVRTTCEELGQLALTELLSLVGQGLGIELRAGWTDSGERPSSEPTRDRDVQMHGEWVVGVGAIVIGNPAR